MVILQLIIDLINTEQVTSKDIRFFLGYSGWDEDQLETELNSNSWVVVKNSYKDPNYLKGRQYLLERKNVGIRW